MTDKTHCARLIVTAMIIALLTLPNCSEDKPAEPLDSIPPSAITDLDICSPADNSPTLTWTAPGDDGNTGTANRYDIRYSDSSIDDAHWQAALSVDNELRPKAAGGAETLQCTGLIADTTYYYAMKTADEESN